MITDIIFDFFGTLVGYEDNRELTKKNTSYLYLRKLGFEITREEYGKKFDKCFVEMENKAKKTKKEFHMNELGRYFFRKALNCGISESKNRIFISKFIDDWDSKTVYLKNINGFIRGLSKKYRLSILSNTHYPALIHDNLRKMCIKKYFYKVFTSVEIGTMKPNREIFEFALKALKIRPGNAVFAGDNYRDDYLGARKANMKCYLIGSGKGGKTVKTRIDNLFELGDKIGEL